MPANTQHTRKKKKRKDKDSKTTKNTQAQTSKANNIKEASRQTDMDDTQYLNNDGF
eukprot:m.329941 g.329941  ORF g.329941 m.329941 type:complete len:56 (-) comp16043_c0_seq2:162-329(-)